MFKAIRIAAPLLMAACLVVSCSGGGSGGSSASTPDRIRPVITIIGSPTVELAYGSAYEDEGAAAQDDRDGSVPVVSSGSFDTFTAGTYSITYTAQDRAGNSASATRSIIVLPQKYRVTVSSFGEAAFQSGGTPLSCNAGGDVCTLEAEAGDEIQITADVALGWNFEYWRACDSVQGSICNLVVNEDKLVLFTARSQIPVALRPGVFSLSPAQVNSIRNFNPQADSLYFASNTDLSGIGVGTIILADGRINPNVAFARRVVDVLALSGAPTLVETIDVPMDQVVQSGSILLTPDEVGAQSLTSEVANARGGLALATSKGSSQVVTVVEQVLFDAQGARVTVSGTVELQIEPEVAIDVDSEGIVQWRAAYREIADIDLNVNISGNIPGASFDGELAAPTTTIGPFVKGPFVFNLDFTLYAFAKGGLAATYEPGVSVQRDAFYGLQWHRNSGFSNLTDLQIDSSNVIGEPAAGLKAEIEVGGGSRVAYKLYGIVGPFTEGELYGGARWLPEIENPACVNRQDFFGLRFNAGGEFSVLSERMAVDFGSIAFEGQKDNPPAACASDTQAPGPPVSLSATPQSSSRIFLAWAAPADEELLSYEVWRRDPGAANPPRPRRIAITTTLDFNDVGLAADSQYCYYVLAADEAGNKSAVPLALSCARTFQAIDTSPPTSPQITSAQALSTTAVQLSWSAAADNEGVSGYNIIDVTNAEIDPFFVSQSNLLTGTVSKLNPDTEYCYRVVAKDVRGNLSQPSNRVCVTTSPPSAAEWVVFLGCQQREFLLQANLDLDETINSLVEVSGAGLDYDGTALTYSLRGIYDALSAELAADIFWTFETTANIRQDRFTVALGSGDSGIVPMVQLQTEGRGCEAQIRIVKASQASETPRTSFARSSTPSDRSTLGPK